MFLQLVTPPFPPGPAPVATLSAQARQNADSLFLYHPLQITATVETFFRQRYNAVNPSVPPQPNSPFVPWPTKFTREILQDDYLLGFDFSTNSGFRLSDFLPGPGNFTAPLQQPGIQGFAQTNWDHLIYAYLIENTRIFDIFSKVLETYMYGENLPVPDFATQQFLRNTEYLIYGDGMPAMVWTTASRLRRDEIANRMTVYYWMFGIDLAHAQDLAAAHPYIRPEASNREFIPTFESFASEVWKGIENATNTSGVKVTDDEAIATTARRIFDMMATRRLNGNLSREEFRAVTLMSWLHLAVMYDSAFVQWLSASGSSPEQRLQKIAERVGMSAHSKSKALFDLAQPFSFLLQSIETNFYNSIANVPWLYTPGQPIERIAEVVIDQYYLATGRDLKATQVAVTQRAANAREQPPRRTSPPALPAPAATARAHPGATSRGNGHAPS
jgi:hypothetical protein